MFLLNIMISISLHVKGHSIITHVPHLCEPSHTRCFTLNWGGVLHSQITKQSFQHHFMHCTISQTSRSLLNNVMKLLSTLIHSFYFQVKQKSCALLIKSIRLFGSITMVKDYQYYVEYSHIISKYGKILHNIASPIEQCYGYE